MTKDEQRKINKENEQKAIEIIKELRWYQTVKEPSKASVLVEDVLPIIIDYIARERLRG